MKKDCISAFHTNFPNAEVKGCVGLKSDIDIKLKLKLKYLTVVVPINNVRQMLNNLAAKFPDDERYTEVSTYFFSTYIDGTEILFHLNYRTIMMML